MEAPTHEANAGIHLLRYPESHLVVRVDRIREDSKQNVSGEVLVQTTNPGVPGHLSQGRLNLTSPTARRALVKDLGLRYNIVGIDWAEVFEQVCRLVLEKHREGTPPVTLRGDSQREPLHFLVRPLLVNRRPNLWYGAGGSLKSFMADYLALLMVSGVTSQNGLAVEPGRVLYLDYETYAEEHDSRLGALRRGGGLEAGEGLVYRECSHPVPNDIEAIQRIVLEASISLVIVDSMVGGCGDDMNQDLPISRYFGALRTLAVTTLTIDHLNKEGKLYGNIYKYNQARSVWEVRRAGDGQSGTVQVGFYHRKANTGKLSRPMAFQFVFTDDAQGETEQVAVTRADILEEPELAAGLSYQQRIIHELRGGALSVDELALATGIKGDAIRLALSRGKGKRFIQTTTGAGPGSPPHWGLLAP